MFIAENIAKLEEQIQKACGSAGRKRDEVTLMGVTKFVSVNRIEEAFSAGIRYFGESRVKEAAEKFSAFRDDFAGARLHMIGSLQRNKAKQAMRLFDCIQSVDRIELVEELAKHSGMADGSTLRETPLEILLELHTGEKTKSGFSALDDLFKAAEILCSCANLKAAGLMTMAPFTKDTDSIRASFRQAVKARTELEKRFPAGNWKCLSMGMSNDFETAVEEGSTMLRIGSAVFGD